MIQPEAFRKMALSYPEVVEQDHWGNPSFRIKKKIFATLQPEEKTAVLKLNEFDRPIFWAIDSKMIFPVEGAWGKQGWTKVDLTKVKKEILIQAMNAAYCTVAPKKIAEKFRADI
ncbi:hypothetical protein CH373_06510 [Leptospira perolatii]|uniref:MmcQ/YjbR family DNA-binding protein n=1 Tax=Leptospira perolatii TaxID=2023191 RepID=A0A2M9ZP05_9LEPT|nr:MmcQ/YjbR family DNA-binding protein [Leptospira perolatii]PJZ70594.1 hypothetical protein CH360_03370 [Leptospira perolatii]PJZ73806.1 hypothetical protein CH373_06510 [Leptospira perolatii]